jgi:paraquat-inducible protein B
MSGKVTPTQVGTFVLAALFLALGLLLFFSTTTLFSSTQTYILYFEDSVKGLSVGSSVKFKGVPIGQVKKIYISYNQPQSSARIPVLIEIDSDQLLQLAQLKKVPVGKILQREIDNGLRAQLQLESFITGILFIDLNYFPDNGPPMCFELSPVYPEIPTVHAPLSELGNSANDLIARLNSVDYEGLADELRNLASNINRNITDMNLPKIAKELNGTLTSMNLILARAEKLDLAGNAVETLKSFNSASKEFSSLSAEVDAALKGNSEAGVKLHRLAENLSNASDAVSRLADYLERKPNAILTGKSPDEQ